MSRLTNEMLEALADNRFVGSAKPSELLLPVREILRNTRTSLRHYASALVKTGLAETAMSEIDELATSASIAPELAARAMLMQLYLDELNKFVPSDIIASRRNNVLTILRRYLPRYQPSFPQVGSELRPVRVEVVSSSRIDLGMGGISDLMPWVNEQPGKAVSLCAKINQSPPVRCVAEATSKPGVYLESVGRGSAETVLSWEQLADTTTATSIAHACLAHLFYSPKRSQELPDFVASFFGGGLRIQTFSDTPKGLGSSSILAAVVLQALLRLLGHSIDWQELVHRVVTVERMIGVDGGWEDALPAFFGGIVIAESVPSRLPIMSGRRLTASPHTLSILQERLVLFDTGQEGHTGEILSEGILRYLAGSPATLDACNTLLKIAGHVASAVEAGDIERLGALLNEQWDAWKTVTGGLCRTDYIDDLLAGAKPWIDGAKVNGAGSGGAILFVAKDGRRDQLLEYLHGFEGTVISWQPDPDGYELREWYEPVKLARSIKELLPSLIQAQSSYDRHGEVAECRVEEFVNGWNDASLVGPLNPAIFDLIADLPMSVFATAAAIVDQVGTATKDTLRSKKKQIDASAAAVFSEEMHQWRRHVPVGTSEGKDEYGEGQPTVETALPGLSRRAELRTAVDVVDGTTLAATGQPGAYSICAVGEGLRSFPDLQAYAILAPTPTFDSLDLVLPPELAIEHNLQVIAQALGKRVDELIMVCHSEDTGIHHRTLIQAMQARGVSVIVPDPVIVEPPYAVAACVEHSSAIDGMIGVFGLPEIAINTVLCGILNRGKGLIFRLASNAPLQFRDHTTLDGIFDLTAEERAEAVAYGLSADKLYTFENITSGFGCMFAGAALTDDPVLGLRGVTQNKTDGQVMVEGWLADPCGNLHELSIRFGRPSLIDYSARHPLPIFDISLVIELDRAEGGVAAIGHIERLGTQIRRLVPSAYFQPFHQTPEGDPGLHITLFEFVVDYVPSANPEMQEEAFDKAIAAAAAACRELRGAQAVALGAAKRTPRGVIVEVALDSRLKETLHRIGGIVSDYGLFNILSARPRHHISIARFTEVLTEEVLVALDQHLASYNEFPQEPLRVRQLFLKQAARTPFRDMRQSVAICVAD